VRVPKGEAAHYRGRLAPLLAHYRALPPDLQRAFRQAIATPRARRPRKAARDQALAELRAAGAPLKSLGRHPDVVRLNGGLPLGYEAARKALWRRNGDLSQSRGASPHRGG
jgi:hypothetical protein